MASRVRTCTGGIHPFNAGRPENDHRPYRSSQTFAHAGHQPRTMRQFGRCHHCIIDIQARYGDSVTYGNVTIVIFRGSKGLMSVEPFMKPFAQLSRREIYIKVPSLCDRIVSVGAHGYRQTSGLARLGLYVTARAGAASRQPPLVLRIAPRFPGFAVVSQFQCNSP